MKVHTMTGMTISYHGRSNHLDVIVLLVLLFIALTLAASLVESYTEIVTSPVDCDISRGRFSSRRGTWEGKKLCYVERRAGGGWYDVCSM